jgi:sugar lactone lactonase YvrE
MMRRKRIPLWLVLALLLPAVPASAAPDDPYLVYLANREVAKGGSLWPVILRADASTGALTEISRNGRQGNLFVHPYDLAVERDGSLIVVDMGQFVTDPADRAADGAVIRVDPTTGIQSLVSKGRALVDPAGVAVGPDGGLYVVENVGANGDPGVIRVDPGTGVQSTLTEGERLCNPFGIAFEASGDLLVADYGEFVAGNRPIVECPPELPELAGGSLTRIHAATGEQVPVSGDHLFNRPFGLAVEPSGRVLVANEGLTATAAIVAVDPHSGDQSVVTPNTATDVFRFPERIALAPDGQLLVTDFQLDDLFGGVVRVSPAGGTQARAWQGEHFNNPLGIAVVVNRPPAAALAASPATVAGGQPVTFDASATRDPEGLALRYDWDLDGDGAFEGRTTTPTLTRVFAGSGTVTAHVRVRDPHGGMSIAEAAVTVDATAPVLNSFRSSARTLLARAKQRRRGKRPSGRAARTDARHAALRPAADRPRRTTTFRFRMSEPAAVTIRIERALPARRVRGRCRAPRRRPAPHLARCTRWGPVVTLRRQASAGANAVLFSGRVRGRRILAGRYRATAAAIDVVGNRSLSASLRLRAVAPRR